FYPTGENNPLSYQVGRAYIPAASRYPEACYRWITTLAGHTELFYAMPARYSLLSDPVFKVTQPPSITRLYDQISALAKDSNTVLIGEGGTTLAGGVLDSWLNEVYNQYILEDSDLKTELGLVHALMIEYLACIDGDDSMGWRCAIQLDPSLEN